MLPTQNRLRDGTTFRAAVRRGARVAGRSLVLHLWIRPDPQGPGQLGLVVSRAVGPAVTRNRVKRRLRHLVRARIDELPAGSVLVIRALPDAAASSSSALDAELRALLGRLLRRVAPQPDPALGSVTR